jgi:hypothetical protein
MGNVNCINTSHSKAFQQEFIKKVIHKTFLK